MYSYVKKTKLRVTEPCLLSGQRTVIVKKTPVGTGTLTDVLVTVIGGTGSPDLPGPGCTGCGDRWTIKVIPVIEGGHHRQAATVGSRSRSAQGGRGLADLLSSVSSKGRDHTRSSLLWRISGQRRSSHYLAEAAGFGSSALYSMGSRSRSSPGWIQERVHHSRMSDYTLALEMRWMNHRTARPCNSQPLCKYYHWLSMPTILQIWLLSLQTTLYKGRWQVSQDHFLLMFLGSVIHSLLPRLWIFRRPWTVRRDICLIVISGVILPLL